MDKIVVLDFGSQYSHLICRRIREFSVYAELVPFDISYEELQKLNPKGVIFSGGPSSVYSSDAPVPENKIYEMGLPLLGICYGHQLIVNKFGGKVKRANKEYGSSLLTIDSDKDLLSDVGESVRAWMSHGDEAEEIPPGFQIIGHTEGAKAAAIASEERSVYGIQFHPEVVHTEQGTEILKNFVLKVCKAEQGWSMEGFIDTSVEKISKIEGNVLCGVSGGVDSTVVAALLHKAIGSQSTAVLIDHGLLRKNEARDCVRALKSGLGVNINMFDESDIFLSKLKGVTDPEKKRKIIGNQFIYSFDRISAELGEMKFLAQGTLYPDVVESGVSKGKTAHMIKSHHNVGGLPDDMTFELVEPLRELFKDEVRNVGRALGLPESLIERHPFPGPGLAVRIMGDITKERIQILQEADQVYMDILHEDGLYNEIWQAFAVLIPVKTVGVMGDQRTYESLLGIRAVTSTDGMTADWYRMPADTLSKISNRIVNSVRGINRVVYDITSKPPGTIEWE